MLRFKTLGGQEAMIVCIFIQHYWSLLGCYYDSESLKA